MKGIIPLIVIICYFSVCYPQSRQSISGIVFNARSGLRIGSVLVKNPHLKSSAQTNDWGEFNIRVKLGDTVVFSSDAYTTVQIIVSDFKDKVIQLQPSNTLAEVVVMATPLNKDLQDVADAYKSKGIFFQGKPSFALLSPFGGSPLTFLYEMTSKDAKHARRFNAYSTQLGEDAEINKRFNDKVIISLVAVQINDINAFMERFTPTITEIREWNDVELYDYIKRCYKEFIRRP